MTLASYGRTELRMGLPVLALIPVSIVFGRAADLALIAFSLVAHELAHATVAHRLGYTVSTLEIQVFGCVMTLRREPSSPSDAAAIAAAGPAVSLLVALCSAGLLQLFELAGLDLPHASLIAELSLYNLTVGAVNALPVLPLDGGRLALALISRGASGKLQLALARRLALFGAALGGGLCALGVFLFFSSGGESVPPSSVTFAVTGGFILLCALRERKFAPLERTRAKLDTRSRLLGGAVRVFPVAMDESSSVREALMALSGTGYGVVFVTDGAMRVRRVLDEGSLLLAAQRGETDAPLKSVLPLDQARLKE